MRTGCFAPAIEIESVVPSQQLQPIKRSRDARTFGHRSPASFHNAGAAFLGAALSLGGLSCEVAKAGSLAMFCEWSKARSVHARQNRFIQAEPTWRFSKPVVGSQRDCISCFNA